MLIYKLPERLLLDVYPLYHVGFKSLKIKVCLKGTHARDFHGLFITFFLHHSFINRYQTQYSQHFDNLFQVRPDI
jgi:hypothetical protein